MSEAKKAEIPQPTAEIVKHPRASMEMTPRGFDFNLDGAIRFAQGLIDSGMVPKGVKGPGAVVGLIEAGKELGLQPMYALSNLTFTNGRLGIMGDAAKALIRKAGVLEPGTDFEEIYAGPEYTPEWTCTVTAQRKGHAKPFENAFSIANAITAKLVQLKDGKILTHSREGGWGEHGSPWSAYTKRMLMYRALGFLVRDRFSDILGGAVLTEELRDYPQDPKEPPAAPPQEPDPLLAAAVNHEPPADAVEAEIVTDSPTRPPPSIIPESRVEIPDDERQLAKAIDRLEGKIVSAESLKELDSAWSGEQGTLARVSKSERERLNKLYRQNATNFEK